MTDLEGAAGLEGRDPGGLLPTLASAGAQVRETSTLAAEAGLERLASVGRPRSVLLLSAGDPLGGPGALAAAAVGAAPPVPVIPGALGDGLAPWVGAADAVLVATSEGSVAEAEVVDGVLRRGAALAVAAPAGSPVAERAGREASVPLLALPARRCHPGALWSQVLPLVLGAVALGLPGPVSGELEETALRLESLAVACRPDSEVYLNPAKDLAAGMAERVLLVWGTSLVARAGGVRLARVVRDWAGLPAVAGRLGSARRLLTGPAGGRAGGEDIFADPFLDDPDLVAPLRLQVVLVRDEPDAEAPDAAERCAELVAEAEDRGVRVATLLAQGGSRLERLASLAALADWSAAYLALATGLDPLEGAGPGPGPT